MQLGLMADEVVRANTFKTYQEGIAENTKTRHKYDLIVFNKFLAEVANYQCDIELLMTDISSWAFITYGMIELFKQWQLQQGYAIGTVNVRIGTIRKYATLAHDAGVISSDRYDKIQTRAKPVSPKQAVRIDEKRPIIRKGYKKATAVPFTSEQVDRLIFEHPNTPIGARDAFLMVLLYRMILRCGEVARLTLDSYNQQTGELKFYRPKVHEWTNLKLPPNLKIVADRYFEVCKPDDPVRNPTRCLVMGSNNKGQVLYTMQERSITRRVEVLCERILGIKGASAHDGRHSGTTELVKGKTDIKTVMEIGGWKTPAMPLKYVNAQKIANEGATYGKVE
jgi:site-specific recombinase XerD